MPRCHLILFVHFRGKIVFRKSNFHTFSLVYVLNRAFLLFHTAQMGYIQIARYGFTSHVQTLEAHKRYHLFYQIFQLLRQNIR